MAEIRLRIDSSLEAVREISTALRALCVEMSVADSEAAEVELAAVEGANNAIKHGYGGHAGSAVDFLAVLDAEGAKIEISNTGKPIEPEIALTKPRLPNLDRTDPGSLPERGLGLSIIYGVMDQVTFGSSAGRNFLRMSRRWRHPPG